MQYRNLGRSGTIVSAFALGAMTFGKEADEEASFTLIDDFFAAGGNFIDTADVYSTGVSETVVGRWLKARPEQAGQAVIATKARFPMGPGKNDVGTSRRYLGLALDASLKRLGIERVDLYQMHAWDHVTPLDETLRFLDDAISAGKIAYYGFSNYLGWHITKAVGIAHLNRYTLPVTLQPQYNLLQRDIEHEIIPACQDAGLGLLPWSPLGGGWLTGKYQRDTPPSEGTRLGDNPARGMEGYSRRNAEERTWQIIDTVCKVADERGVSMAEIALAWVRQRPAVTSVILGVRTREQLADNLKAADLELSQAELDTLDTASAPQMLDYPYGERGIDQRKRGRD
jgi:aryl-alcohol dehydrogenase-like predicted oxidoreductase